MWCRRWRAYEAAGGGLRMNRLEAGMALAITMSAAVAMLLFAGYAAYGFFIM